VLATDVLFGELEEGFAVANPLLFGKAAGVTEGRESARGVAHRA
jgi:hypothetical protein